MRTIALALFLTACGGAAPAAEAPAKKTADAPVSAADRCLADATAPVLLREIRARSSFDTQLVFDACAAYGTAVEINCRPERQDPTPIAARFFSQVSSFSMSKNGRPGRGLSLPMQESTRIVWRGVRTR